MGKDLAHWTGIDCLIYRAGRVTHDGEEEESEFDETEIGVLCICTPYYYMDRASTDMRYPDGRRIYNDL